MQKYPSLLLFLWWPALVKLLHHILSVSNFLADMQFMLFASRVCQILVEKGFWADYIDPCSGLTVSIPLPWWSYTADETHWLIPWSLEHVLKFSSFAQLLLLGHQSLICADEEPLEWMRLLWGGCFFYLDGIQDSQCRVLQGLNTLIPCKENPLLHCLQNISTKFTLLL